MTSRPYYVGYGRWRQAMQGAACLATKRDDAWIISPHRIDTLLCKYSTTIFLVNDVSLLFILSSPQKSLAHILQSFFFYPSLSPFYSIQFKRGFF